MRGNLKEKKKEREKGDNSPCFLLEQLYSLQYSIFRWIDSPSLSGTTHNHETTEQMLERLIKQLNLTFPKGECLAHIAVLTFLEPSLSVRCR